jgi:hypothetical protein
VRVLIAPLISALLWASFDGLAMQPPAPSSDCSLEAAPTSARRPEAEPVLSLLDCQGWAVP